MDEIRCPMCGKSNPADLENCQYCQARLKPLANKPGSLLPDWMENLRSKKEPEQAPAQPPADPETPDWLSRIRERSQEDKDTEAFSQITLPDWLTGAGETPPPSEEQAPENPQPEPPAADEPSWLSTLTPSLKTEQPEPEAETEIPEWLKKFTELGEQNASDQDGESAVSQETGAEAFPFTEASLPSELPASSLSGLEQGPGDQPAGETELPDWLKELAPTSDASVDNSSDTPPASIEAPPAEVPLAEPEALESPLAAEAMPGLENESPDWLKDFQAVAAEDPEQASPFTPESAPAEFSADLPDWLGKLSTPQASEPASPPAPASPSASAEPASEPGEPLAPAEIPSWVKAIRPIENITAIPEPERRVEERGPLAGLQGVLPAEPGALDIAPSPSFAFRLQATERQRGHQALLESLLASEAVPIPLVKPAPRLDNQILRWVTAALLLLAVILPIASGVSVLPVSEAYPGQAAQALATVDTLPQNVPVLVAVDYEPSLAGEMEAAAAGVIDNLMSRGARLAVVSTSPTGSALATRLIEKAAGDKAEAYHQPYLTGERIANLGYLPGGAAGLLGFAQAPQAAAPFTVTGQYAWNLPVLQGVHNLSDFGLVLLITENPDTGRGWVEQVRPAIGDRPLVLVSSAQAAPMMLPYLDSGQINGMVTGITGGAVFEQYSARPGLGQAYAGGYQAALVVAICIIAVGAIVEAITLYLKSHKAKKEA